MLRDAVLSLFFVACLVAQVVGEERPNVLFIAVDDLRPALGCFGDKVAISPNLDRLASRGVIFRRAYCQEAVCAASRLSLLTGRRPDTIRVWDLQTHFREAMPDIVSLPQLFRLDGYHTRSIGKIYHGNGPAAKDPLAWSEPPLLDVDTGAKLNYADPANREATGKKRAAYESPAVDDDLYVDGHVAKGAIAALGELSVGETPFFLAVGFKKPHLPFNAPKRYWDLYDRADIGMPLPATHPVDAPELATRSWRELEGYQGIPKDGQLSDELVRTLRHGYYACVSYVDAQIGRVLDELDRLNLADETIVVLWGDHGFQIGEQGMWTKANNFELATRVPLIVRDPRRARAGLSSDALVEFVDIYPTLAELCGIDCQEALEGSSFVRLLDEPNRPWKTAAFSQYPRDRTENRHRSHGHVMGYAIRTDRHRYVEWREWDTKEVVARELYDHQTDPAESRNVADDSRYASTTRDLAARLAAGWRAALPSE